jgi:hypothetical protein
VNPVAGVHINMEQFDVKKSDSVDEFKEANIYQLLLTTTQLFNRIRISAPRLPK